MRTVLFVVWSLVIWQIAAWTFAPPPPLPPQPIDNGQGFGSNEKYTVEGRDKQRQDAFNALDKP